jgi:hypothetical protein
MGSWLLIHHRLVVQVSPAGLPFFLFSIVFRFSFSSFLGDISVDYIDAGDRQLLDEAAVHLPRSNRNMLMGPNNKREDLAGPNKRQRLDLKTEKKKNRFCMI